MTAQIGEVLYLNGELTSMASCPPLPDDAIIEQRPKRRMTAEERNALYVKSTANWRGYIGHWAVADRCLFFLGLQGQYQLAEPLLAEWFSGQLVVFEGKCLKYIHMGFASIFERERYINILCGRVTSEETVVNSSVEEVEERRHAKWIAAQPAMWAKTLAERQAAGTPPGKRSCPRCGALVPSYRETCRECKLTLGRIT